ncbi:PLP-dependent aminotransferase family protein [Rhodococcus sp. NPDC060086]|uniref:MocR-like pyridoxine biosynthesis transcription factor PdxR n=1 Tax=Rhodococcus sp. NPDC060086 TaxID=3347055 RepID=UPI003669C0B7
MPRVSPPVHLPLVVPDGKAPLRHRIAEAIVEQIRLGHLRIGDALPSSRVLAAELGVARGGVVEAYDELAASGFVVAVAGSATRIAAGADTAARAHARPHPVAPAAAPTPRPHTRYAPAVVDLRPGLPDTALIAEAPWRRAWRRAANTTPTAGSVDPLDHPELRRSLAAHLRRNRGIALIPDDLVILPGVAAATRVLAVAAELDGRDVAFEDPGYHRARRALVTEGARIRPVPVDGDGLPPHLLADTDAAVYCTPAHQYPLGSRMPVARRAELVERASAAGMLVIEDDYDGEFRYDVSALPALRSVDGGRDCVAYLGTASKILSPALRLAWLIPPDPLRASIAEAVTVCGEGANAVSALALSAFIDDGSLTRHLARTARTYRARRAAFVDALRRKTDDLDGVHVAGIDAGLHVVLSLPDGLDDAAVAAAAEQLGVRTTPVSTQLAGDQGPRGLVCGYACLPESAAGETATVIAAAVRQMVAG